MSRARPRLVVPLLVAAGLAALLPAFLSGGRAASAAPADMLPNLIMAKPYGLYVQRLADGGRRLRFGSIAWNVGRGPLEIHGRRDPGQARMTVRQRIYDTSGGFRGVDAPFGLFHAGDGHDHWHMPRFMLMELYHPKAPESVRRIRKLGYCLLDIHRRPNPPADSPTQRAFYWDACGTRTDTRVRMGISVGWGDDYEPHFTHQWLDVTGLVPGTYRLCATVNPRGALLESTTEDNGLWMDLALHPGRATVEVLAQARENCRPGDVPPPSSPSPSTSAPPSSPPSAPPSGTP